MKHNGFTLIEVLVAISILFVAIKVFIPISLLIYEERSVMSERRIFSSLLHDELQIVLLDDEKNKIYTKKIDGKVLEFKFKNDNEFLKGCVTWVNVKNEEEDICFYAFEKY